MGEIDKGIIESILEMVNRLPIDAIEIESEVMGMQLIINDGFIIDMIY